MPAEWIAPLAAFPVCWLLLAWLLRRGRLPMDHPNEHSLHATPTPRAGGLAIMAGVGVAAVWLAGASPYSVALQALLPVVLAAFALAAVSVLAEQAGIFVEGDGEKPADQSDPLAFIA